MSRRIEDLAEKMGAKVVGEVPDFSAGAFGVAQLAHNLRSRLEPGHGKRPGRPSNPNWNKRRKIPLAELTAERLEQLARVLSDEHRKISPMQVAAQLLEEATASYFSGAPLRLVAQVAGLDALLTWRTDEGSHGDSTLATGRSLGGPDVLFD